MKINNLEEQIGIRAERSCVDIHLCLIKFGEKAEKKPKATIKVGKTESFEIRKGLKLGCCLLLNLFKIIYEENT